MCHKMTELTMKELECEFVETTAHAGARTGKGLSGPADHASWQGQVFCYKGKSDKYPDGITVSCIIIFFYFT